MLFSAKRFSILLLPATLTVFAGSLLGSQDIHYNNAQGTDFSKYRSYAWISLPGEVQSSAAVDRAVHQAVDNDLAAKGLIKADSDKADLWVACQYSVEGERQWDAFSVGGYQWGMGLAGTVLPTLWIQNGTLVVDMYDPTLKELVWTGQAPKAVNNTGKQKKGINNGVKKLLKEFPPQFKPQYKEYQ